MRFDKLSENLSVYEFFVNEPDSAITAERVERIYQKLVIPVLQPLRDFLETPIIVTSGYRNPEHNRRVGGHPESHHLFLEDKCAADIWTYDLPAAYRFLETIQDHFCYAYWEVSRGFIHISGLTQTNKRRVKLWAQGTTMLHTKTGENNGRK